jgi:hypothetical protein
MLRQPQLQKGPTASTRLPLQVLGVPCDVQTAKTKHVNNSGNLVGHKWWCLLYTFCMLVAAYRCLARMLPQRSLCPVAHSSPPCAAAMHCFTVYNICGWGCSCPRNDCVLLPICIQ